MPTASRSPNRRRSAAVPVFAGAIIVLVVLAAGGFAFAATQETHDSFCASCHTQPETTFFENETAGRQVDLASYHAETQQTTCINCHSGPGIMGRAQAELMGARNAFKWYTGTAVQPALLTYPIGDENCLKCHGDVTARGFVPKTQIPIPGGAARAGREEEGRANHWHQFMSQWQATSPAAGKCTDCHPGHGTGTTAQAGFMNTQQVQATCDACHQVLRREGG